jgi:glycogen operon protein
MDYRDNAGLALKARVVDDAFDWGGDRSPQIAPVDTVIYEVHGRGYSRLNPRIPQPLRGTYAGLAHAVSIAHLQALGVTSLCLLPVHLHLDEERLVAMGLRNHWGYNTLGFFCVEPRYASAGGGQSPRDEFKSMVKALHAAGFEVLLDVVFNHTNLSFRVSTTPVPAAPVPRAREPCRLRQHADMGNPRCCNW